MTTPTPLLDDPALSPIVLTPEALADWLSDRLGRPVGVVARRLRHKPGTSATVAVELSEGSGLSGLSGASASSELSQGGAGAPRPVLVTGYAAAGLPKLDKTVLRAGPALLTADRDQRIVVTTLAGDRAIPGLRQLLRSTDDAPVTLRHNPQRRWIGMRPGGPGRPAELLRAYSSRADWERALAGHRALARTGLPTPAIVDHSRRRLTLTLSWTEGLALTDLPLTDRAVPPVHATGHLLARLHTTRITAPAVDPDSDDAALRQAVTQLRRLLPDTADAAREVRRRLVRHRPTSTDRTAIHGDFSADQVVVTDVEGAASGLGGVALIDLDRVAHGSPAADLGSFAAVSPQWAAALREGYAELRPLPDPAEVTWHEVAQRLRRAAEPLRSCRPDWREQVTANVAALSRLTEELR